jgi:hypothetical protein
MENEPHAPASWRDALTLANASSRCGARRKADGNPCQQPVMPNGRCRMHGGMSTGPRTAQGLERSRKANWKHGWYSAEAISDRRKAATAIRLLRRLVAGAALGRGVIDVSALPNSI